MNQTSFTATMNRLTSRPDIMVASMLILAMAMMILPMPIVVVDILVAFNLATALMLIMTAIYLTKPLDFSSLPVVIVITTVFRLAVEITITRLILSEADAGEIIKTFGEFVIGGNIAVGIIIFMIITIVQFLVISKGAERVAEVAARFTLDGMPGRQMSIDADLRNGDIDAAEAKRRRSELEEESQLFGAMDGAMKFVKGDTIAGLLIVIINLAGGISIGVSQRGMTFSDAAHTYALLSIGEALISQIPSLLLAISSATIVTRVKSDDARDLGGDVFGQLAGDGRALQMTAVALLAMALVPGFPYIILTIMAALFGAASFVMRKAADKKATAKALNAKERADAKTAPKGADGKPLDAKAAAAAALPVRMPIKVVLSSALNAVQNTAMLEIMMENIRLKVSKDLGIVCPKVGFRVDEKLTQNRLIIEHDEVPTLEREVRPNFVALNDERANLELLNIPYEASGEGTSEEVIWIDAVHTKSLQGAGIGFRDSEGLIAKALEHVLRLRASSFIGIQETKGLFQDMEKEYVDLTQEVWRVVPVSRIADVFRRLLDEDIPLRHTRLILEGLAEWGEKEPNTVLLSEFIRPHLKRQICFRYANEGKILPIYLVERNAEEVIRQSITHSAVGPYLALSDESSDEFLEQTRRLVSQVQGSFAIVCALDVRRYIRGLLSRNSLDVPVLSYQDLSEEFTIQPCGSIHLSQMPNEELDESESWAA
jgi:type III secretion protein V